MISTTQAIKTIVLDGPAISKSILSKVGTRIESVSYIARKYQRLEAVKRPKLGVLTVGEERADAGSYLTQKKAFFADLNLDLEVIYVPSSPKPDGLLSKIDLLNLDPSFSGIMMYLPLPTQLRGFTLDILQRIQTIKDVECLNPTSYDWSTSRLVTGDEQSLRESASKVVLPCTYLACLHVLDEFAIETFQKKAVVIGSSYSVGKPIATMLQQRGALVEQFDKSAGQLTEQIKDSDIIVTATGSKNLFDLEFVKNNCTVLDLGLTALGEGKYRGDVPYDKLIGKARLVTPVPKGIGPITSAMLIRNLALLWERQLLQGRSLEDFINPQK